MRRSARSSTRLASTALAALSVMLPTIAPASDRGQMLASSCMACHGPGGESRGAIPSIGGKAADYVSRRLREFRDGVVTDVTVMDRLAKGYSDEEIDAIARYLAGLR